MDWIKIADICICQRKRLGYTQEELAENAQISKSSVQRLEAGKKINAGTLMRILIFLNIDDITVGDIRDLYL